MSNYPRTGPFRDTCETMLQTAFHGEGMAVVDRLEGLHEAQARLERLLRRESEADPSPKGPALLGWATLCYVPSLETVAAGQPHNLEVAQTVSANLQTLAERLVEGDTLSTPDRSTRGFLSEAAILSQLWWGIAYGHASEKCYATFTTRQQDASSIGGRLTGIDIIMRQSGGGMPRHHIQVKSSRSDPKRERYAPGIAIITPPDLVDNPGGRSPLRMFFRALADNDQETLGVGYERAAVIMQEAQRQKKLARLLTKFAVDEDAIE